MENIKKCSICLEPIETNNIYFLPCIHFFHSSCIDNWLYRKIICPICRIPVFVNSPDILQKYLSFRDKQKNCQEIKRQNLPTDDNSIAKRFINSINSPPGNNAEEPNSRRVVFANNVNQIPNPISFEYDVQDEQQGQDNFDYPSDIDDNKEPFNLRLIRQNAEINFITNNRFQIPQTIPIENRIFPVEELMVALQVTV